MMSPDFNDIVFKGLNKDYGAYCLRKSYARVLGISIILAVLTGCTLVIIPYLRFPAHKSDGIYSSRIINMENLMVPDDHGGVSPPPPPPVPLKTQTAARHMTPELKYVAPRVVDTVYHVEKPIISSTDSVKSEPDGREPRDVKGDENGAATAMVSGSGTGEGGGGGDGTGNGLYTKVDVMPSFRGGDINKFREWVQKKTKYPQIAEANEIQGKVYITFVIEKDGSISNVKVARGVDPLIDIEALKAVMSSPKWKPGMHNGKVVRVSYYITVNFEL
jgi:periplasmic protein TonB